MALTIKKEIYRSPFGSKEPPVPEYADEGGDTKLAPIVKHKGGRFPVSQELPENIEEGVADDDNSFLEFFGNKIYKGTKEEAKKKKEVSRSPASKKEEEKDPSADLFSTDQSIKTSKEVDFENGEKYGEEHSNWGEAWEGFKGSYSDIGNSVRQLYNYATGDEETLKKLQNDADEVAQKYDSTAGRVGYLLGSLSQSIPLMLLPTGATQVAGAGKLAQLGKLMSSGGLGKMVGIGALQSVLSQPTTSGQGSEGFLQEKGLQAGIGAGAGALGAGLGKLVSKIASPTATKVGTRAMVEAGEEAEKLGFKLTPAQLSKSNILQNIEEGLASQPGGSGVYAEIADKNRKALNRLGVEFIDPEVRASRTVLQNPKSSAEAIKKAEEILANAPEAPDINFLEKQRASAFKEYANLGEKGQVDLGSSYLKEAKKFVKGLGEKATGLTQSEQKIVGAVNDLNKKGSKKSSKYIMNTLADIRDTARNSTGTEQKNLYKFAGDLEEAFEKGLEKQGDVSSLNKFRSARQKLAKIHRLEKSVDKTTGEVNPNTFFTNAKKAKIAEKGLQEDLDLAASLFKETKPFYQGISPTAQKQASQKLVNKIVSGVGQLGLPIAGATIGASQGGTEGGITGLLAGLAGGRYGAKLLTSEAVRKNILKGLPKVLQQAGKYEKGLPLMLQAIARERQR